MYPLSRWERDRVRAQGARATEVDTMSAFWTLLALLAVVLLFAEPDAAFAAPAAGPLRVHPTNPRYFTDGSGRAVYLTGSHTWPNLKDLGPEDPPTPFDYDGYLSALGKYNHNFIRLWTWELTKYVTKHGEEERLRYAHPHPWPRTGPGKAVDGKPRFDLSQFNQEYFDRLRSRVMAAGERGMYVSVMLFEGYGVQITPAPWRWDGHPMNSRNNVNGIDGLGIEVHTLQVPEVTRIQEAYVRKVIDTVGDLDNVLYEIANESGPYSTDWQYHIIRYIKEYEAGRPKQHPVGMTFQYKGGSNATLMASPADWISPNPGENDEYRLDPPPADGRKVILSDTDHLWGIGGNVAWVWKSFTRGLNPLFMDPWQPPRRAGWGEDEKELPDLEGIRLALGHTREYAQRMDLAAAPPHPELASSRYCLASPGSEYLVFQPDGGEFTVDLSAGEGKTFSVEWCHPKTGRTKSGKSVTGGAEAAFESPFAGPAVLYLKGP